MNREEAKKLAPVIQAYAEGKTVQYKTDDGWHDSTYPGFSHYFEWRVKPETKEVWVIYDCNGRVRGACDSKDASEADLNYLNNPSNRYPGAPFTMHRFTENPE